MDMKDLYNCAISAQMQKEIMFGMAEKQLKRARGQTQSEEIISKALIAARDVQDFLWGEHNKEWDLEEWKRMFRKRIQKIDDIDPANPHAFIELKKRLLQNAALSIALLQKLEKPINLQSNLENYASE